MVRLASLFLSRFLSGTKAAQLHQVAAFLTTVEAGETVAFIIENGTAVDILAHFEALCVDGS